MAPIWWSRAKGRIWGRPTKDWVCAPRWNLRGQNCAKSPLFKKRLWKILLHTQIFVFKPWHIYKCFHIIILFFYVHWFIPCMSVVNLSSLCWWVRTENWEVSIKFLFLLSPPSIARHLLSCWCWSSHWTPTSACSQRFCLLGNLQESGTYIHTMIQWCSQTQLWQQGVGSYR